MSSPQSPQETDRKRVRHLTILAAQVLARLSVPCTRRALRNTVKTEYVAAMRGGTVHAQVSRMHNVVDRRDSTNGLIVLCKILRRYHVRCVVGESSADRHGVHVAALPREVGSRYEETLLIVDGPPTKDPNPTYVVFYANELSGERHYSVNARREQLFKIGWAAGAGILLVASALGLFAVGRQMPTLLPVAVLSLVGLLVSAFLVAYEVDPNVNAWAAGHVCEQERLRMSCASVLKSRASKLFGMIPLADIGTIYFAGEIGLLVAAGLAGRAPEAIGVMLWYSILPLPMSLVAITYQASVVKAWCPLCLCIHWIVWMEAATLVITDSGRGTVNLGSLALLALFAMISATLLYLVRQVLSLVALSNGCDIRHQQWSRDGQLFKKLFSGSAVAEPPPDAIHIGDQRVNARLLAVLSPGCVPCGLMVDNLSRLLDWFDGKLSLTIVLTDGPLQSASLRLSTAMRSDEAFALIKTWYHAGDGERNALLGVEVEPTDAERSARSAHSAWLKKQRITVTPTLYFNGRIVPEEYYDLALLGEMIEDHWTESVAVAGVG